MFNLYGKVFRRLWCVLAICDWDATFMRLVLRPSALDISKVRRNAIDS